MLCLGYDLGSSFVKGTLLDSDNGSVIAAASYPEREMPIISVHPGWAEQDPRTWWEALKEVTALLASRSRFPLSSVGALGISYQMHGLVLVDQAGTALRHSIIWCDSRATEIGRKAFADLGESRCLREMLNSPGNFTASKLRWVKQHEPLIYERAVRALLPGDYLALRLTGEATTTVQGISEGILWNFPEHALATALLDYYELRHDLIARIVPSIGIQGHVTDVAARELGLNAGIPLSYRAGDQPNNAFSLNVLEPGEIASTAGTSGVVYAVYDSLACDPLSRINAFAHVNHTSAQPRIGVLLCINGTGSANSWIRRVAAGTAMSYDAMNQAAATVPVGSRGLSFLPFGNGAERMLGDRTCGAHLGGLNFNIHSGAELFRAVQEGVAFAFAYGIDLMRSLEASPRVLRAGAANMFLSPVFCSTLSTVAGVDIELLNADGAQGAARAASVGAGAVSSPREAFQGLKKISLIQPEKERGKYLEAYHAWVASLKDHLPSEGDLS